MKKLGKKAKKSHPDPQKLIAFPGRDTSKPGWHERFDAASPAGRVQLLRDALDQPRLALDEEDLTHAFATVGQILSRANQVDLQLALAARLERKAPEVYAWVQPVQDLQQLQADLFDGRDEKLPALIARGAELGTDAPPGVLQTVLRFLIANGRTEQATHLAAQLRDPTDQETFVAARLIELDAAREAVLRQLLAGKAVDWKAFAARLKRLDLSKQNIRNEQESLSLPPEGMFGHWLLAHSEEPDVAIEWALVAFCRWLLAQYGMAFALGRELLVQAYRFWDWNGEQRWLNEKVSFSRKQLRDYLEQPGAVTGMDQLDLMLLLSGLPYVCEWLESTGLITTKQRQQSLAHLAAVKPAILDKLGVQLWHYAFVYRWPAPVSVDPTARAAEARRFAAARKQTLPLSEKPEDSRRFDEPPVIPGTGVPDEIFAPLLGMLAEQDPRSIEILEALADRLSPQQMVKITALIDAIEAAEAPTKAGKARRSKPSVKPAKTGQPLAGTPQPSRYDYFLNIFSGLGFTRCPSCDEPTKVRRFNLLVLIEAERQMICVEGSHRFCTLCELLIIKRLDFENEIRKHAPWAKIGEGQGWQLAGTLDRKDRDAANAGELSVQELYTRHYPLRRRHFFNIVPPHWCFDESKCWICQAANAEMEAGEALSKGG
ncbi:MAG: hypothetical protein ACAI44_04135 [Candidatus Sericytochromatia bacterium]